MEDIVPQIKNTFNNSNGRKVNETEKYNASESKTISAGSPYSNCDNANPSMYVNEETGEATNTSCILYSIL
jgi:hypothetical protein